MCWCCAGWGLCTCDLVGEDRVEDFALLCLLLTTHVSIVVGDGAIVVRAADSGGIRIVGYFYRIVFNTLVSALKRGLRGDLRAFRNWLV